MARCESFGDQSAQLVTDCVAQLIAVSRVFSQCKVCGNFRSIYRIDYVRHGSAILSSNVK